MRLTARFDRRPTLRFDVVEPTAPSRAAKTRVNTRFQPAHDGPERNPRCHRLRTGRRRVALRFPPAAYRSPPVIGRRADRVRRDAQWRVARCRSRCRDGNWSRAIRSSRNRNRDDRRGIALLAPRQRRMRSTAMPLRRQVLLHSWSNLLAFDCLARPLSLDRAVYSFSSFTTFR
jgi:hypothetical protein